MCSRLCVQSRLGALVTSVPDAFRRAYCYCEPTCTVLKQKEAALRRIFAFLTSFNAADHGRVDAKAVAQKPWLQALRALGVIAVDLSEARCAALFQLEPDGRGRLSDAARAL